MHMTRNPSACCRYLDLEFEELREGSSQGAVAEVLEVGCGTGNTVFPLLAANPNLFLHCCDFAAAAVELVKTNPEFTAQVQTLKPKTQNPKP